MKTYTVANQKGGVGKTTLTVHLAYYFAKKGKRVLFLDFDGQGNSTKTLSSTSGIAFESVNIFNEDYVIPETIPNTEITLVTGTHNLIEIERLDKNVVFYPREHIKKISDRFDVCIIDTPPTLGLRLVAALILSDYAICPIDLGGYATDGIEKMVGLIHQVKTNPLLNPDLELIGIVANRVNLKSNKHRHAFELLYSEFSDLIISQPLVERIYLQEATDTCTPVWDIKNRNAKVAGSEWLNAMAMIEKKSEVA